MLFYSSPSIKCRLISSRNLYKIEVDTVTQYAFNTQSSYQNLQKIGNN